MRKKRFTVKQIEVDYPEAIALFDTQCSHMAEAHPDDWSELWFSFTEAGRLRAQLELNQDSIPGLYADQYRRRMATQLWYVRYQYEKYQKSYRYIFQCAHPTENEVTKLMRMYREVRAYWYPDMGIWIRFTARFLPEPRRYDEPFPINKNGSRVYQTSMG